MYEIDINKTAIDLLPPDKRYINNIAFIQSLLTYLQWLRDLFFGSYYIGSTAPVYSPGSYNYLQQVRYQKKIYMSLINSNTDLPTSGNWLLVQNTFVGLKERVLYNGSKLVLEYALNKEFDGTFRNPQTPSGIGDARSDIYIDNLPSVIVGFLIGETEDYSSSVGQTTSSATIGSNTPFSYINNFTIRVPLSLLNISLPENEKAVRNFVNKYIPASINFTIVNY